jgi:hypothetical protein
MANGGKLLAPRVPAAPQDQAKLAPVVRRQLSIEPENFRRMVPGMVGAVNYGSGKRAYDPVQTVAGKTGTCIGEGSWLGLFTSYAPLVSPRLAVVVIAKGSDGRKHLPAAVAGQIYRDLNKRFGTPMNLQIANTQPPADDAKAAALNEEEKDAKEAEAAEEAQTGVAEGATADADADAKTTEATPVKPTVKTRTTAAAPANRTGTEVNTPAPPSTQRNTVKSVLMPIERRPAEAPKDDKSKTGSAPKAPENSLPSAQRPRRTQPIQP